ncbi:hypothetical protein RhiirA1_455572 [Rhizophagus irregularis]|uniref:Uncharacterized protein n=2 Tax=Rhizophagus irregularis TaxID=588596 RepID=A0A2N0S2M8_9GLOM|nr:hypothetical protein GLOIN_2v1781381 [Rhizophagus irregularis DAOM 181602=DAOM 197198]PKC69801.1 hypothetical protein RhiirA1_455572 [Rhizophagus irregularis]POG65733.1 hypothetical protein GLOIN_2v1781381 [Rhizophagus irregularis DAOM 181602=DAOM 197198]GET60375.1 kinase-like domain-containing protein [Rhizophagus irregularis DAOM 181602=DAOM 197198]|eukprot:XP_025172599.1 hypothetical protein GLOIN_2v1781381 [Rhizophagus irregularis DAOM 181602=DAOM 197198]
MYVGKVHQFSQSKNSSETPITKKLLTRCNHLTGMVNLYPNIIQFYGVTKLKDEINYSLVLESGTLGKYLRDNIITFK